MSESTSPELYRKHRPHSFKGMFGQAEAVRTLQGMLSGAGLPHAVLLTGPSGCGKTTLARILKTKLECSDQDFNEINAANFNGIDTIRGISSRMGLSPIGGKVRIYLVDEFHQMTTAAQNAFLKVLEDTPAHVYFFLATTEPQKLLATIITRCTEIRLKPVAPKDISALLAEVCEKEGRELNEEVGDKIVELAEGSPRKALVLLNSVIESESTPDALAKLGSASLKPKAIELARVLIDERSRWPDVAKILKGLTDEEPEQIRHMVLGYCASVLLNRGTARVCRVMQCFERAWYDSKRPGLVLACYEAVTG